MTLTNTDTITMEQAAQLLTEIGSKLSLHDFADGTKVHPVPDTGGYLANSFFAFDTKASDGKSLQSVVVISHLSRQRNTQRSTVSILTTEFLKSVLKAEREVAAYEAKLSAKDYVTTVGGIPVTDRIDTALGYTPDNVETTIKDARDLRTSPFTVTEQEIDIEPTIQRTGCVLVPAAMLYSLLIQRPTV